MQWRVIALLSFLGFIMGSASLFGVTEKIEPFLWLIIALVVPVTVARSVEKKIFMHGLLIGIGIGLLNSSIQAIFFDTYLAANPETTKEFHHVPIHPQWFVFFVGPAAGTIYGAVLGGFSLLARKFHHPS